MQIRVLHVFEYFKEDVKIIWYEVGENEDAISLFTINIKQNEDGVDMEDRIIVLKEFIKNLNA